MNKYFSTSTNLVFLNIYVFQHLDANTQVDVIYTNFTKAFERVNRCVLLHKQELTGFSRSPLFWIASYLADRRYYIGIDGSATTSYLAFSGVPQGSPLDPILFNLFINDLPTVFTVSHSLLYANDAKIFHSVESFDEATLLQHDLNRLVDSCSENILELNVLKCKVMHFTR